MRARPKIWTAVTALVLVAGGSLAACSGGAGDAEVGETLTQTGFFDDVTQAQLDAGTSHLTLRVGAAGQQVKAEGDVEVGATPADTAMAMTVDTGQPAMGALEMRIVDRVFYVNIGPLTQNKFATIDLADPDNLFSKQFAGIVGSLDPAQQLKQFKGAVTSFEQKGKVAELDGVQAKPYVIEVDATKIAGSEDVQGADVPKTLTYTLYVGPDDLPRRLITKLPAADGAFGGSMTIDYSKWGEDVSIAKPEPSEITDQDLLGQLGGGLPQPS